MSNPTIHSVEYQRLVAILKDARKQRGLTQGELAAKIGGGQALVSRYESAERRLDVVELREVCRALDLDFVRLVNQWENAIAEGGRTAAGDEVKVLGDVPVEDADWDARHWKDLLESLIETGLVTYKEVAALLLGHLYPSQVGTSIASKKSFQAHYPSRKCWEAVRTWHFAQSGQCLDCGTRLELQADHVEPLQHHGFAADRLDNMTLRCRRCNVVRRPSHKQGGLTFLTAEAALMWLLLTKRPRTYQEFNKICRAYGMTMAAIRFQEAWAMAHWLQRDGLYEIDPSSKY